MRYGEALAQHLLAEVKVQLAEAGARQQQTEAALRPAHDQLAAQRVKLEDLRKRVAG